MLRLLSTAYGEVLPLSRAQVWATLARTLTRMLRRLRVAAPGLLPLALVLLTACGGDETEPAASGLPARGDQPGAIQPTREPCLPAPGVTTPLPPVYPAELPLPEGTVVTAVKERGPRATVEGYVPGTTIESLLRDFEGRINRGGFTVESSDYEGFEGEYFFRSDSVAGFVRVANEGCLAETAAFGLTFQSTD